MEVRTMAEEDIPEVSRITKEEVYAGLSLEEMEKWVRNGRPPYDWWFVAVENDRIVGAICLELFDQWGERKIVRIPTLAVRKAYRGKGIWKELSYQALRTVNSYWQEQGAKVVMCLFNVEESNLRAIALFDKVLNAEKVTIKDGWRKGENIVLYIIRTP